MRGRTLGALTALAWLALASTAQGTTHSWYTSTAMGPWALSGHSIAGGTGGTLPNGESPSPSPWNLAAGDYCTSYKFTQPSAPTKSAPFTTWSATNLVSLTGMDVPSPRDQFQLRHVAQTDSSTCQAAGTSWGFWINAGTGNNYCSNWCGVRHDRSFGTNLSDRPWADGFGGAAKLVMYSRKHVQSCSGAQNCWSYLCAMLQDQTTSQYLEYCLRPWRSWTPLSPTDPPTVFHDTAVGLLGTGFTNVVTDITVGGTAYASNWGGTTTSTQAPIPSTATYAGAVTRGQLGNALAATNATVKAANLGTCLGLPTLVRCYSTNPNDYVLLGLEDGQELAGGAASKMGGYSSGLAAWTDY